MTLHPASIDELQRAMAAASATRQPLPPVALDRLRRLLDHQPEDLTCSVETGCRLADLQEALARRRQWLPLDPPFPDRLTLREVLDQNLSGPSRFAFGTVRDHLIGLEAVLPDGSRIRSGGRVVKNVAGYDLHKLFIGARGSLGVPVVAHFRLLPLPEASAEFEAHPAASRDAGRLALAARDQLRGVVALDVLRSHRGAPTLTVWMRLAGNRPSLALQAERAVALGFQPRPDGVARHDQDLWRDPARPPASFSVVPARLPDAIERTEGRRFVARAGQGIVYHEGPTLVPSPPQPRVLLDRLKAAFDPANILPPLPA